jgi:hypothetical protein
MNFSAILRGGQETPPNATSGRGVVSAQLDTNTGEFDYSATYSGLTGPATAAHFHGPALPGVAAGVVIPVANVASPIHGSAQLTPAQMSDLISGKWYFNVHTAANPKGEIRGQVRRDNDDD